MPINPAEYHESLFRLTQALGEKINAGDATFEPIGFDGIYLLTKQFPHPHLSGGMEIETAVAGGGKGWEQGPYDPTFQGQITFYDTVAGTVKQFARDVVSAGGYFDARIYEGTPQRHTRSYVLEKCFFRLDPSDRDWENRTMLNMLNGTLFGHYFGKESPGNI